MRSDVPLLAPEEVLRLDPAGVDGLLDRLEAAVPRRRPLFDIEPGIAEEAVVFGDTHGDWRSTVECVALSGVTESRGCLIGLGDYVDRSPPDSPCGSVANALYLLSLTARFPERVVLTQGNHEGVSRVTPSPHQLPEEVQRLWGPGGDRYARLVHLLERGPLAVTTPSGAYLAHAGFPRELPSEDWHRAFDDIDEARYCEITWAECAESRNRRGAAAPWNERDLERFLDASHRSLVLRGHDPDITGRWVYHHRSVTLQTTRHYERFGGVIAAHLPLGRGPVTAGEVRLQHLSTEGRRYSSVADLG